MGCLLKENQTTNLKRYMTPMFIVTLFIATKIQEQSINKKKWMKKIQYRDRQWKVTQL